MIDQEKIKALKDLIDEGLSNHRNARLFYKIIKEGINTLSISKADLADAVDVSRPTVDRWLDGRNAPYRALRPLVYKWFLTGVQLVQSMPYLTGDSE